MALPDLETEILIRSGRVDQLPFSDPIEDSFVRSEHLSDLRAAVEELRPGDRMLVDRLALDAFARLKAHPGSLVVTEFTGPGQLAPLQEYVLRQIGERFGLRPLHRDRDFLIVELVPFRASEAG